MVLRNMETQEIFQFFAMIAKIQDMQNMTHPATKYAEDVLAGRILACKWVKLACQRFMDDLEHADERGFYFDEDAADFALEFFSHLKLWKGREYKGKEFVLAPHYQFITANIFGWKRKSDGFRRFRTAYIEMARKGAKSTYAAGVGAFMFIADGEDGAEVYCAATKKDQAKIVWNNIENLTKKSIFARLITSVKNNLSIESMLSKCEPLSSDTKSLDGLDTHCGVLDELHAHPTPAVHDLVDDSVGARSQPLILIITTAGFDQDGVCYQRREYLARILKGLIEDDTFFGIIYTLDMKKDWPELKARTANCPDEEKEDDWQDEENWIKSMPGICGITKSGVRYGIDENGDPVPGYMTKLEDVRKKATYAAEIPAAQNNFLTKRMDVWTQQVTRWISLQTWDENNTRPIDEKALRGRLCYGGIDLSAVSDLTVWVMLFPDKEDPELLDILIRVWCPESKIYDTKNKYRDQYQAWERDGLIEATEGDAIDYDFVRAQIVKDAKRFRVDSIAVDRLFQGYEFAQKLDKAIGGKKIAPKVVACGMGYYSMAGPCKEFESRLLKRKLNHGGNPILRFMADSVSVSEDPAGNKKPNKDKSQGKIDGIVGILLGLDRVLRSKPRKAMMPAAV